MTALGLIQIKQTQIFNFGDLTIRLFYSYQMEYFFLSFQGIKFMIVNFSQNLIFLNF